VKPGWRSEDSIERWRKAKRALQGIWMAETKKDALAAFDAFAEAWGVKYDKAVECLIKDRDTLLAFC
jgi:transposase-like protein